MDNSFATEINEYSSLLLGPKGRNPRVWAANQVPGLIRHALVASDKKVHRTSCHKCGNIRKKTKRCTECPYVFCGKCVIKMYDEFGKDIFEMGCPVVSN